MRSDNIEAAVVQMFEPRKNLIVPRITRVPRAVYHECDLLICSESGYLTEVEIKVSAADLRADVKKGHGHRSDYIKHLYYAIPESLITEKNIACIPADAGIIAVREINGNGYILYRADYHRRAKVRGRLKINDEQLIFILRNLQIKFWSNKAHKTMKPITAI